MSDDNQAPATTVKPPQKNDNEIPAKKYYVFNGTGNVMISSTIQEKESLDANVQKVFAEASVFYAGMVRAITTLTNPKTKKPYSIYDYDAIKSIVDGSGLFVNVTQEDVKFSTESVGANFSKELIEGLLGLATGTGELAFAQAMVSSIGNHGFKVSQSSESKESKVGSIIFICEYLMGVPTISVMVVYMQVDKHTQQLQIGPCIKEQSTTMDWKLHKDTYLFVTPSFITEYSGEIDEVQNDAAYTDMVNWFQSLVLHVPKISGVYTDDTPPISIISEGEETGILHPGQSYQLMGQYLPTENVSIAFDSDDDNAPELTIQEGNMTGSSIAFSVPAKSTLTEAAALRISYGSDKNPDVVTSGSYTVAAPKTSTKKS